MATRGDRRRHSDSSHRWKKGNGNLDTDMDEAMATVPKLIRVPGDVATVLYLEDS